jgi:hypothetical protein
VAFVPVQPQRTNAAFFRAQRPLFARLKWARLRLSRTFGLQHLSSQRAPLNDGRLNQVLSKPLANAKSGAGFFWLLRHGGGT